MAENTYTTLSESQPTHEDRRDSKRFYDAIRQGSVDAIAMHAAAGRTIAVCKDGQVVRIPGAELLKDL
jgi:hypothetical protein